MKMKSVTFPYIIWMVAFTVIPLLMIIYFAFTGEGGGITFNQVMGIGKYMPVFLNSFFLAFLCTVICLVVAYPMAYALSRASIDRQKILILLVTLPMWMSFLLKTYAWMTLLEDNGLINHVLGLLGIGPFHMINTAGAVVLGMVYDFLPFMILPLYTVMIKIDKSLLEAADDLGSHGLKTLTGVIIPLSLPGIISGATMVFVPAVSTFVISRFLGGSKIVLIGDLIETQFVGVNNPYLGSALSLILMVVIFLLLGIMSLFDNEEMEGMMV